MKMNLKQNGLWGKPPQIQILQRRTCSDGRAQYKIRRVNQNNKVTWEPIKNLKTFMRQISDFDKNYEERISGWNPPTEKAICLLNNQIQISQMVQQKDQNHEKQDFIEKQQQQKQQYNKNSIWGQTMQNQQFQTLDKSQIGEQKNKNKQVINLAPIIGINQQFNNQTANEENRTENIQQQNKRIVYLLRKRPIQNSIKTKYVKNRSKKCVDSTQTSNIQISQIKDIYCKNKTWYALIVRGQEEKQILRDELRITQPKLLLSYYQRLYQQKQKRLLS